MYRAMYRTRRRTHARDRRRRRVGCVDGSTSAAQTLTDIDEIAYTQLASSAARGTVITLRPDGLDSASHDCIVFQLSGRLTLERNRLGLKVAHALSHTQRYPVTCPTVTYSEFQLSSFANTAGLSMLLPELSTSHRVYDRFVQTVFDSALNTRCTDRHGDNVIINDDKKLSYRRETARQLRMSI